MISIDVPPNATFRFVNLINIGSIAISAKNKPPNNVNFVSTDDRYSVVGFPALIPGMNPPLLFLAEYMYFAHPSFFFQQLF